MRKRFFIMLAAVFVAFAVIGFIKYRQVTAAMAMGAKFAPPPPAVATFTVKAVDWQPVLASIGTVEAVQGVMVSTDLPGIVEEISFRSGTTVKKGDVLVKLDTRQEEAKLNAIRARRELARANFKRIGDLLKKRVASQSDYDTTVAEFKQADASVKEVEALIDRKTIRAPFDGILGIRRVNLGQYLKSGDEVVSLQSLDPIFVNFNSPQQHLAQLQDGRAVRVRADGLPGESFEGKISAIDPEVDKATRNLQVQAVLANPQDKLRSGMFVEVEVLLPKKDGILAIPASAVDYAPYGNSVFVVEEMKNDEGESSTVVRQRFVQLGNFRGDLVEVVKGLQADEQIVSGGTFKLRDEQEVTINNDIQVGTDPNPTPPES